MKFFFKNNKPLHRLFEIPLLDLGGTKNFNPDFIVWVEKDIIAIDTKKEII